MTEMPHNLRDICTQIRDDGSWAQFGSDIRVRFLGYEQDVSRSRYHWRYRNDHASKWLRNFWFIIFIMKTPPSNVMYINEYTRYF